MVVIHFPLYDCIAHVMEEVKEAGEGVKFFTASREHWVSSVYGGHLTWHLCLYYLGQTRNTIRPVTLCYQNHH